MRNWLRIGNSELIALAEIAEDGKICDELTTSGVRKHLAIAGHSTSFFVLKTIKERASAIVMEKSRANGPQEEISDHAWIFSELAMYGDAVDAIHFRDMVEVSDMLMSGYARFVRQGMPREMVGFAMLGATMNLYDLCDMRANLPQILRRLADRIEQEKDH